MGPTFLEVAGMQTAVLLHGRGVSLIASGMLRPASGAGDPLLTDFRLISRACNGLNAALELGIGRMIWEMTGQSRARAAGAAWR